MDQSIINQIVNIGIFERINASGLGLTIGSIGPSISNTCINNITFRNAFMQNTIKGIYMKARPGKGSGIISNILYENIRMQRPTQVSIWIGPQQAIYDDQCSLLWPQDPFAKCPITAGITWVNITLRNIVINNPKQSPGVILGNSTNPMQNIIFDNVLVNNPGDKPWGNLYYKCEGVASGIALNGTYPVPPCFKNRTYGKHYKLVKDSAGLSSSKIGKLKVEEIDLFETITVEFLSPNRWKQSNIILDQFEYFSDNENKEENMYMNTIMNTLVFVLVLICLFAASVMIYCLCF